MLKCRLKALKVIEYLNFTKTRRYNISFIHFNKLAACICSYLKIDASSKLEIL